MPVVYQGHGRFTFSFNGRGMSSANRGIISTETIDSSFTLRQTNFCNQADCHGQTNLVKIKKINSTVKALVDAFANGNPSFSVSVDDLSALTSKSTKSKSFPLLSYIDNTCLTSCSCFCFLTGRPNVLGSFGDILHV